MRAVDYVGQVIEFPKKGVKLSIRCIISLFAQSDYYKLLIIGMIYLQ
jgi:hypothetical protein